MKVILLRDVAKIGRRNEIVEVPDGYAQNQLVPKRWAAPATPANLKKINTANAVTSAHKEADQGRFKDAVAGLRKVILNVMAEPNEQGHLFKAIHEQDIVEAANLSQISLDKAWLQITTPIKSLGQHQIVLKYGDKKEVCVIEVVKRSK